MIYDSSDKQPGLFSSLMQLGVLSVIKSPVISTFLLFLAGALFAGVVMMSYPNTSEDSERLPVIQANSGTVKSVPDDRGGMVIPNRDSTVFQAMRGDLADRPVIENLLEPMSSEPEEDVQPLIDLSAAPDLPEDPDQPSTSDLTAPTPQIAAVDTMEDTAPPPPQEASAEVITPEPKAESAPEPKPEAKPKAEESKATTETMEYVRSVLQEEKKPEPVKEAPKPSTKTSAVESGSYYVQISSVKSDEAAHKEWINLKKKYDVLANVKYRVVRADLGAKGIYYRVQAGGLSKASAESVCASIKAKSGGCFVVK